MDLSGEFQHINLFDSKPIANYARKSMNHWMIFSTVAELLFNESVGMIIRHRIHMTDSMY